MNALAHILGLDDASGRWYLWWSGIGADLGLLAGAGTLLRRHNCHVHRCPRIGRHPVDGTPYTVCRRHHPDGAPAHDDVLGGSSR